MKLFRFKYSCYVQVAILIIFFIYFFGSARAENTSTKTSDSQKRESRVDQVIKDQWLQTEFPSCLQKNKLKLKCGKCEYVYIDVEMSINEEGKLAEHKILKENKCGRFFTKKLEECFLEYFYHYTFPTYFRG